MSDETQKEDAEPSANPAPDNGAGAPKKDGARVKLTGIVEKPTTDPATSDEDFPGVVPVTAEERRWNAMSRQVWQVSRLSAVFVFFSIMVGLPLGNFLAHQRLEAVYGAAGDWSIFEAYSINVLMFAFIVPILVLLCGYLLSKQFTMMTAAESIAAAAQQFASPDVTAVENVETVGSAVQTHVSALNEGIDSALTRLATVEAMIRQHVEAIEIAGEAIEHRATGAVTRVADERSRLMELTENLNSQADNFAAAIAERAKTGVEAMQKADTITLRAESEFEDRLGHLENIAQQALTSFESLRSALRDTEKTMRDGVGSIEDAASSTVSATEKARHATDAAVESAARNAANVAASAGRARDDARKAADEAIAAAATETSRIVDEAIGAATEQSEKIQKATTETLEQVTKTSREAVEGAVGEAAKASLAAEEIAAAAQKTSDAAAKAAADVEEARKRAQESSEEALQHSHSTAAKLEERNKALAAARADLEKENLRLETLIEEQRKRADRLADAISSQTERLSRLAETQLREQEAAARAAEAQASKLAKSLEDKKSAAAAPKQPRKEAPARNEKTAKARQPGPAAAAPSAGPSTAVPEKSARLDELARDIAERRTPKKRADKSSSLFADETSKRKAPAARDKNKVSWKEIIDAAEDAAPIDIAPEKRKPAPKSAANGSAQNADAEAARAIKIISTLQGFTYDLETRLYGDPPPALRERYERGDRNVFANRLLRLNEADVKRRIRSESGRDKDFERGIHGFLQGFEQLLEDATTSETADEELEEYLSSPLGRVYLLIGATVGYFA